METQTELQERLEELAFSVTDNFCYSCYKVVKGKNCPSCHSDDFMRHLEGVGVEYGTEWVIESLIKEHCTPIDAEEAYEEMLNDCYPAIKIGDSRFEAGHVIKELDPITFRCGVSDYTANGEFVEIDGEYYQECDIDDMIEELTV